MIGHFLLSITPASEDVLLTTALQPLVLARGLVGEGPCLIMAMSQANKIHFGMLKWSTLFIGWQFDALCHRFGTERVTRAVRNRILSNQARRVLQDEMVGV